MEEGKVANGAEKGNGKLLNTLIDRLIVIACSRGTITFPLLPPSVPSFLSPSLFVSLSHSLLASTGKRPQGVKRRRNPTQRDPNAPKRPCTAYQLFFSGASEQLRSNQPDIKFSELSHTLAAQWTSKSLEQKQVERINSCYTSQGSVLPMIYNQDLLCTSFWCCGNGNYDVRCTFSEWGKSI